MVFAATQIMKRQHRLRLSTLSLLGTSSLPNPATCRGHSLQRAIWTLPLLLALQVVGGEAMAACAPAAPVDGDAVSCTGTPIIFPADPNSFLSNANNLDVTVQAGAVMSTLPGATAVTLGGNGITLDNFGSIDADAAGSLVLARGLTIGDLVIPTNGNTVVNNSGLIEGTFDGTFGFGGAAMMVANRGATTVTNSGSIGVAPLGLLDPVNAITAAFYGDGNVNFTNTGSIVGRVGFDSPTTGGNVFLNAGTINGSVSLGSGISSDTFIAVTGSLIGNPLMPLGPISLPTPELLSNLLAFAGTGTVDAGIGGSDSLVLQNSITGPGSGTGGAGTIFSSQYLGFENLTVNSGTWTLTGGVVSGAATLNGGLSIFNSPVAFGTGTLTANGGAIQASLPGLLVPNIDLTGGLTVQGPNNLSLIGNIGGAGVLIKNGVGTLALSGNNTYSGGLELNAGLLRVFSPTALSAASAHTIAGGAVLDLAGFNSTIGSLSGATGAIVTNVGGAVSALTTGGNNSATTFAGTIQDGFFPVSLVKTGTGVFTLSGANTYTGVTTVTGGELRVTGSLGATAVTVASGATLSGAGTIAGGVTVEDGGILAPGASAGTLTVGALNLSGGSVLDYELGTAGVIGGGVNDLIVVNGNLVLDGQLDVTDLGGFGPGVYRLINYGGALTDNGLDVGSLPVGVGATDLFVQTALANQVNLISSAGATLSFWDGGNAALHDNGAIEGGDGIWDAVNRNWTRADGAINGPWDSDFAIFGGAAGTVSVDNSGGPVTFTGMQFMTDGYVVSGDALTTQTATTIIRADSGVTATIAAGIDGNGGLVKTDLGTLELAGTNTYTGGTTIDGGVLSVSADANLGAAAGGLSLNGGTLAATASFDSARAVTLAGGRFDVSGGANLGFSGAVSGAGGLTKQGAGTLTLTGANSYSGGTTVMAGTLVGNAASISGNIANANAGTVVFDQAGNATFAGAITGSGAMVKNGGGVLTLTGTSSLDWSVDAGGLVSAAERFSGDAAIAAGASLTFDQAANATYAGVLSGGGDFVKTAAGALDLTGNSAGFTGATTVEAGTLLANGTLGGTLDVLGGARLMGAGTVGTTTIASGGTVAPGNSIGTLNIAGDITFDAGSTYEVEADPASAASDLIHATGQAILNGGSVLHVGLAGDYQPLSVYTIVTADAGVTGTFGSISSSFAFLAPTLTYDVDNVFLELIRNNVSFCDAAATNNQCATGQGVESLGAGSALYDAIVTLPDEAAARAAFDQLSGEIHASAKGMLLDDSRFVRDAATARIRAAFAGTAAPSTPVMSYGADGPVLAAADSQRFAVWGQAFGAWGSFDGDGNAAQFDHSGGGFLAGGDAAVGENWRLGLLAGYSHSSFDVDDRSSSGDSDSIHLGLYGGSQWGNLGFRAGAAYSWHDIETARTVSFEGFADQLTANYDAGTAQVFGELGYKLETGSAVFEPFVNLAYVNLSTDAFTEEGGLAALSSAKTSTDATFTTLGVRAATGFMLGGMQAEARGMLGWRHAFGDTIPESTFAFAGGTPFSIAGTPIAKDALAVEAGLDLDLAPNATFGISYSGQISGDASDHAAKASLTIKF